MKRPGGALATRPLNFIWMCDVSGSMSVDGKIQALNTAIKNTIPEMQSVADENPNADVLVQCLKFSHGAAWHTPEPMRLVGFKWTDLVADPLQTVRSSVDIVFMVDTSGSMSDEIEAVKRSCVSFAEQIIKEGADVRLGLVGFDIGGHRGPAVTTYQVHRLSRYTIGVWPLAAPGLFKMNIASLSLGLFGGAGCYLANRDTVDIFPHVVQAFGPEAQHSRVLVIISDEMGDAQHSRVLVIISDEMGDAQGVPDIVAQLQRASITAHVVGVPSASGAHETIARLTGGTFWNIHQSKGVQNFGTLLGDVAHKIAEEVKQKMADGTTSAGTDMGTALRLVARQLTIPPMTERALPPVIVLLTDGQPTDDFEAGLNVLMAQPWGKKAVRIAIAIGSDVDLSVLQKFIGHTEFKPLQANNIESLTKYIKWVSTAVLQSASAPASQSQGLAPTSLNIPIPRAPDGEPLQATDVW